MADMKKNIVLLCFGVAVLAGLVKWVIGALSHETLQSPLTSLWTGLAGYLLGLFWRGREASLARQSTRRLQKELSLLQEELALAKNSLHDTTPRDHVAMTTDTAPPSNSLAHAGQRKATGQRIVAGSSRENGNGSAQTCRPIQLSSSDDEDNPDSAPPSPSMTPHESLQSPPLGDHPRKSSHDNTMYANELSGYLSYYKEGAWMTVAFTKWRKRWFVLSESSRNVILYYREGPKRVGGITGQPTVLRGVIPLDGAAVKGNPASSKMFTISTPGCVYQLCAESEEAKVRWMTAIQGKVMGTDQAPARKVIAMDFPNTWSSPLSESKMVLVDSASPEYAGIKEMIEKSCVRHRGARFKQLKVRSISRIQNPELWWKYCFCRWNIARRNGGNSNERLLFHGTSSEGLKKIIINGFDPRVSNTSGMFGAGTYFACNSTKSNHYVKGFPSTGKKMLVCRVSLGDEAVLKTARSGLRRPPAKKGTDLYDSVRGESREFSKFASLDYREYIVYEQYQAYPEYEIEYVES